MNGLAHVENITVNVFESKNEIRKMLKTFLLFLQKAPSLLCEQFG